MKRIVKGREPRELMEHKKKSHADFDNLPKEPIRQALLKEQGYICCYCMKRLPERGRIPGSKIEHFKCQSENEELQLDYKNMLLACMGNEGYPENIQTCDTKKGDKYLSHSPCDKNRNIEDLIKYRFDGTIYSDDDKFCKELNEVLNLNMKRLKDNRGVIYEFVRGQIDKIGKNEGTYQLKKYLETEKERCLTKKNGKFDEYCMVAVFVINKKLKRL